jgi:hypothetical protein
MRMFGLLNYESLAVLLLVLAVCWAAAAADVLPGSWGQQRCRAS